jgi:hypothetical protein
MASDWLGNGKGLNKMNKLQTKLADLKSETDPQRIIDICCAVLGITGTVGGAYLGVKDHVWRKMREAQVAINGELK